MSDSTYNPFSASARFQAILSDTIENNRVDMLCLGGFNFLSDLFGPLPRQFDSCTDSISGLSGDISLLYTGGKLESQGLTMFIVVD